MDAIVAWLPYCGEAPAPGDWLSRWNFDPPLLLALGLAGLAFGIAARRMPDRRRRAAVIAALVLSLVLFVSPFCALTSALFAARSAHHLVLASIVVPLLIAALPAGRTDGTLLACCAPLAHAVVLWSWHVPALYAWALSDTTAYWLMQGSLAASAGLLWLVILGASAPLGILAALATMVQMGLLGALLTFASRQLYAPHATTTQAWGLSPLEDQQMAGVIMWVIGAGIYLAAALFNMRKLVAPKRQAAAC